MRFLISLFTLASFGFGGWYTWNHVPAVQHLVHSKLQSTLQSGDFLTLEIRYSADELMHRHKDALIKGEGHSFLKPKLLYYPYLLMDVKFSKDRLATQEGVVLWGLSDGEMILNSDTWEKTHGFEDCLIEKAGKNDFKIIQALVESGGSIDRERLYQRFKVDQDILDEWVDSCKEKKLIVASGSKFRLHFQNPRLEVQPATQINQALVTLPLKSNAKVKATYTPSQISKLTQLAFGQDFAIRKHQEVFLPVYCISVQNPDGSISTSFWNALNGKKMDSSSCR